MVSGTVSHKIWDEKGINGCQKTRFTGKREQGQGGSDENMKEDEYEKVCFLCRRPESKTGPMITLPQNIHIFCTECMQKSFDTMNNSNMNYGG